MEADLPAPGAVRRMADQLTAEYLEEHRLVPLSCEAGALLVGCAGPADPQALGELEALFAAPARLTPVPEEGSWRRCARRTAAAAPRRPS